MYFLFLDFSKKGGFKHGDLSYLSSIITKLVIESTQAQTPSICFSKSNVLSFLPLKVNTIT